MKRPTFYLIFFLLGLNVSAQTVITGKVTEEGGLPMAGANVYLQGTYDGISSNENGTFKFESTKKGTFDLVIGLVGYEPFTKKVELKGDTVKVYAKLKEAFNQLNAVTITAGTFEAGDKKQAVILTPLDMVTTAGAAGDVYGALQTLPGTTTNGESGRLFVKGGDSEESQTYIDGALVSVPYSSSAPNLAARGRFNPYMFKGTIFSTGGYSAEYGQALSSVLLLNTNDMPAEDQLDLSVLSVGAEIADTKLWKEGAITGTLSYNNLQPYMSIVPQNYKWAHAPEYGSGALSVRQKTGKTGMFKFYSSFDSRSFTIDQENLDLGGKQFEYKLGNDNYFLNASWNGKISEKWALNSSASFTNNKDNIAYDQTTVAKRIQGTFLKSVFSYPFSDKFLLKMGGDLYSKSYAQNVQLPGENHDNNFSNHAFSGFTEAQIYASSKFVTRIGGRVEYSDFLKSFKASPRLSAAYKVNDNSQFSAAYGWFFQNPLDDYLLYTNKLKPERANHYTLSYQSTVNKRIIKAELYYKKYMDLVKLNGEAFYLPSSYSNLGSGYAKGIDLFWRDNKSFKNGDYWISYSYLDTKRNYRDFPKEAIPSFASKHNFSVVYKHWLGDLRSLVSINFKYSSPRVYNDPNSTLFNGEKMLPYRSLDLSWSFLYRQNIIIYSAVTNIVGFRNEFGRRYADTSDVNGQYPSVAIQPSSNRFFLVACFITLTKKGKANQLDKIE